jgi:hypothetical protein
MRLLYSFYATGWQRSTLHTLELPMEISLASHGHYEVRMRPQPDGEPELQILAETAIDPAGMEPVESLFKSTHPVIACPEIDSLVEGVENVVGALSFALGTALGIGVFMDGHWPRIEPDCDEDEKVLERLGSRWPQMSFATPAGIEVFEDVGVDVRFVDALARRPFVRVYAEALRTRGAVATFRELWRTLELAFQAHGKELVELITCFPPAQKLAFDREELEELRALRGRVSHASSRSGLAEFSRAGNEAGEALPRLWSLVDWVVLSKRDASKSLEVEELKPLMAYIAREGHLVLKREVEETFLDEATIGNPRFNY